MTPTDWIAIVGLAGLAIYCIETWKIRVAAQAQLEASRTPCLAFASMPRDGNEAALNMGGARGTMVLDFDQGDAVLTNNEGKPKKAEADGCMSLVMWPLGERTPNARPTVSRVHEEIQGK